MTTSILTRVIVSRLPEDQNRRESRIPVLKLMAVGMLLLQIGWIFALPPGRGIDEFDHVYRAAAVARGQWYAAPAEATRGTGAWMKVPVDIVKAARPECTILLYTGPEDCVGRWHDGTARIASGAGRYHPLVYALIGWPALPFNGYAALYVMRLSTALISWGLFCLALFATRVWARGPWPFVGLVSACTPMLIYSTSVTSPNGIEMMAALCFWTALIGVTQSHSEHIARRRTIPVVVSGILLATVRAMGPVWVLLIALSVLVLIGPRSISWRVLWRTKTVLCGTGLIFLSAVQNTWWVLSVHSLDVGQSKAPSTAVLERFVDVLAQLPLFILQSIAAFPFRDQQSSPLVYVTYFAIFAGLLAFAFHRARRRMPLLLVVVVSLAFPYALNVATFETSYGLWQGRYGLPFAIGMTVVAGFALDRTRFPVAAPTTLIFVSLFVVAQSVSQVYVLWQESSSSPLSGTSAWLEPTPALLALIASTGGVLLAGCACLAGGRASVSSHDPR